MQCKLLKKSLCTSSLIDPYLTYYHSVFIIIAPSPGQACLTLRCRRYDVCDAYWNRSKLHRTAGFAVRVRNKILQMQHVLPIVSNSYGGWKQWDIPCWDLISEWKCKISLIWPCNHIQLYWYIPWFHNHYKWGIILNRIKQAFLR